MHLARISFLVCLLSLAISIQQNEGMKEIPDVQVQEGPILTAHFEIPQEIVDDEIYRRTNQGKVCDPDIRDILIEIDTDWTISLAIADVHRLEGNPEIDPYRYVAIKIHGEKVSLGLVYFTTRVIPENSHEFVVDSIKWSDDMITVKRGQDYLVLKIELGEDCRQDLKEIKQKNLTVPPLDSWYPYNEHFTDCETYGWPQRDCIQVANDLCELQKVDNDFCFKNIYEGHNCGMSMEIMSMSGIFCEKSLITAKTPLKSVSGYYISGWRRMGIVYPCLFID